MIYPKIPLAQSILEICKAKDLHDVVISPGSRNAPLTIGFASNSEFTCYSIADERCAAFFAMGIAQQKQKPVILVCTSGSALLNYYPAVAEAFYSQIPLVVISADRPKNKIDIGDGQTIRQENVFANHILFNANLSEEASEENDLMINQALNVAVVQKGPVHINAPFEEPLYETIEKRSVNPVTVNFQREDKKLPNLDVFVNQWNAAKKKLVLIGGNYPNEIDEVVLNHLANDPSVVVMTEVSSNVHHPDFITNIDTIITPFTDVEFKAFQPDILVSVGGMIVSKRIKAFIRSNKPEQHWHIDTHRAYDTFGCLTQHFEVNPNKFFKEFLPKTDAAESDYNQRALDLKTFRKEKHMDYLKTIPFSDMKVFETIFPMLPENIQLQISNSSPIRYAQLFDIHSSIEVFCNRGTSGIDGSTTTAIGAAVASAKPTVMITGDVSFFYDSNALWNNYIPKDFKIILINNRGGGIFRILPGHQETDVFNTFFETTHSLNAEHLAKMYGFDYFKCSDEAGLKSEMHSFLAAEKPSIIEIFTPTEVNNQVLLNYFKNLK
ncbi:MAG TPA: 2-succinyl-5-enolpyruvyl-6-hydroxy-3-cyclohexene-1-carboxylic-acid synthase [Flavobacterium sp.]|uniref:2-succinyl-5-enolpyruvyl-6-hydroxy-3- cyclohexene-1-carboxylic-acid synthase n=1 Tax=Flavobacterium sp. TaxID=239 RepID=UPI002C3624BE|nr:2-succinyl-5-enolpyruvyl-6-hydroxy-3-cyclohexene-1-carboxylic-acid synthase [Flavobacterium sp.]HSD14998.1 2-succinyl-5-enolpyruvyl-6-hydroxy-3-cyclohexene-1-carboxylic-acid synthase [Flavobacterium sp.]